MKEVNIIDHVSAMVLGIFLLLAIGELCYLLYSAVTISEQKATKYIVRNRKRIEWLPKAFASGAYSLKPVSIGAGYYDEITIERVDDNTLNIICWGSRKSFMFFFRRDKVIEVDIARRESLGYNISDDLVIMNFF